MIYLLGTNVGVRQTRKFLYVHHFYFKIPLCICVFLFTKSNQANYKIRKNIRFVLEYILLFVFLMYTHTRTHTYNTPTFFSQPFFVNLCLFGLGHTILQHAKICSGNSV